MFNKFLSKNEFYLSKKKIKKE